MVNRLAIRNRMTKRRRAQHAQRREARPVTIQAPVGGWNSRDPVASMADTDAVRMENFFPDINKVVLRGGSVSHATNVGTTNVDTLVEYEAGANNDLLAAANGEIYDVTAGGSAPTSLGSGFSVDRWQTAQMDGKMGWVNGTDTPQVYDGATLGAMTLTGPTAADVIGINVFQSRSYFWEKDSQDFWYSSVNALGGTVTQFPLSRVGQFGGNLIAMGTWSPEGGTTAAGGNMTADRAVFLMSSGDVIIYDGTNPGDAAAWSLMGTFRMGRPMDVRGLVRVAADLFVVTQQGLVSISRLVRAGQLRDEDMITNKIEPSFHDATQTYLGNTGWEAFYYPRGLMMIVNIPTSATIFEQYVANTESGAWCKFTGWNARTFGSFAGQLYYGTTDGQVIRADTGAADMGADIVGDIQSAYSYFDSSGLVKVLSALRVGVATLGAFSIGVQPQFDFNDQPVNNIDITFGTAPGLTWEGQSVNWEDWEDVWGAGSGQTVKTEWIIAEGEGYAIGVRIKASMSDSLEWFNTSYLLKTTEGIA